MSMTMLEGLQFIVQEKITVNGKPLDDDTEDGNEAPKYDDNPDEDPAAAAPDGETGEADNQSEPAPDTVPGGDNPGTDPDTTGGLPSGPDDGGTGDGTEEPEDPAGTPADPPADPATGDEDGTDADTGGGEEPESVPPTYDDDPDGEADGNPDPGGSPEDTEPVADPSGGGSDADQAAAGSDSPVDGGDGQAPAPTYDDDPNAEGGDNPDGGDTGVDNGDGGDDSDTPPSYDDDPNAEDGDGGDDPDADPDAASGDPNAAPDDGEGSPEEDGEGDEIDQLQQDLFSDLTPAQIAIKNKELKTNFINLYSDITSILDRLSSVTRNSNTIRTIEFITRKFMDLKDLVRDSLVYTYDQKSYVQNQIDLQKFISIYAGLTEMLEEIGEADQDKAN